MKVLHLFKTYLPQSFTGIERVIFEIAEGTRALGVEPEVLSLSRASSHQPMRIANHIAYTAKLDFYFASTGFSFDALRQFRLLSKDADLVHYHFPWPFMDALHFLAHTGKPTVVTYHADIVRQRGLMPLYRPLMWRFLGAVDRLVATSPNYLASSPVLQRFRDKTTIIPIGIGPAEPATPQLLEQWRRKVGEGFFLFVGALRYYKGLPFLVEAARLSGLPVVIAGRGAIRGGLPSNVRVLGEVDDADKQALLELSRAFVFPSHLRAEAFGVALLEASRAARPSISCEIGTGTSFVNIDGETGLVVPPADAPALAEAMLRLARDPELARRLGAAAATRYAQHFSAGPAAVAYKALYEEVLAARGRTAGSASTV